MAWSRYDMREHASAPGRWYLTENDVIMQQPGMSKLPRSRAEKKLVKLRAKEIAEDRKEARDDSGRPDGHSSGAD